MSISRFSAICAWLLLAFIIFSTVSPIEMRPSDVVLPVQVDRALAYLLLAGAFVVGYPKHWLIVAIACITGAFAIEALQYLSASRHPHLADAFVKAVGAFLGAVIGFGFNTAIRELVELASGQIRRQSPPTTTPDHPPSDREGGGD